MVKARKAINANPAIIASVGVACCDMSALTRRTASVASPALEMAANRPIVAAMIIQVLMS